MAKKSKEEWKIYGNVFDNYTNRLLFKLSSQGYFEELKSPISIGKEANVFSAVKKDGSLVCVKIYRLESCNFNKMFDYIKADPRYIKLKKQRRKVIFSWVQREYRNLLKVREVGVRVPAPYVVSDHVIVMELIGDKKPAPMLKDLFPKNPEKFVNNMIKAMRTMYKKAGIVHADFSEFNTLNYKDKPVLIDMSQGTTLKNPEAEQLLKRDVKNLVRLAKKMDVELNSKEVLEKIKK